MSRPNSTQSAGGAVGGRLDFDVLPIDLPFKANDKPLIRGAMDLHRWEPPTILIALIVGSVLVVLLLHYSQRLHEWLSFKAISRMSRVVMVPTEHKEAAETSAEPVEEAGEHTAAGALPQHGGTLSNKQSRASSGSTTEVCLTDKSHEPKHESRTQTQSRSANEQPADTKLTGNGAVLLAESTGRPMDSTQSL